jgi:peptidoglycan glycosyltransferase
MNRALFRISLACLAMFVLLLVNVNYVQAFESSSLAAKPGNIRVFDQQFQYQRGPIIAYGDNTNTKIADSVPVRGSNPVTYRRHYRYGPEYAQITGYDTIYSATGIEQAENRYLNGTAPGLQVHNLISLFTGKPKTGASVYLTISPKAQRAAYDALLAQAPPRPAAVVAINPSTGAILAMASYPTFNPNVLTTFNGRKLVRIDHRLLADKSQPLLNRAINETYPPGSSFKVVTSSAAFSTGKVSNPGTTIPAPTNLQLPGSTAVLINDNHETCGDTHPPITQAFYLSCNTAFGDLGIKLGGTVLHRYADRFGVNNPNLAIPLPVSASFVPEVTDRAQAALTAIGQFDDRVTPLQEAMFAAAIANHGTLMTPYMVQQIQAPDLSMVSTAKPAVLSQPVSRRVAGFMTTMMEQVTENPAGTAYATANPSVAGVVIAGKTGTAQNGINNTNLDDAVFTCFAPAADPKIAVGVIVQGGGFGAAAAAPIAGKVIRAYLGIK